jgi:hypothetical protein
MNQTTPTQPESSYAKPDLHLQEIRRATPGAHQVVINLAGDQVHGKPCNVKPGETVIWSAQPGQRFKPLGVLIWGAAPDTLVTAIAVGNMHGGIDGYSRVPARYFETGRSLAEIERLAAAGELAGSLPDRLLLGHAVCEYGCQVSVRTVGPFEGCCMWGLVPDGQYSNVLDTRIWWEQDKESHRAEVVGLDVTGPVLRFAASTETESAAVELVKAYLSARH